jgi:putative citrate transport
MPLFCSVLRSAPPSKYHQRFAADPACPLRCNDARRRQDRGNLQPQPGRYASHGDHSDREAVPRRRPPWRLARRPRASGATFVPPGAPSGGNKGVEGAVEVLHTAFDYASFMALLGALFTISGGICLRGSLIGFTGRQSAVPLHRGAAGEPCRDGPALGAGPSGPLVTLRNADGSARVSVCPVAAIPGSDSSMTS